MVVTGQAETKVIEGLTNLHADAVIIGTHDRNTLSRYAFIYPTIDQGNVLQNWIQQDEQIYCKFLVLNILSSLCWLCM